MTTFDLTRHGAWATWTIGARRGPEISDTSGVKTFDITPDDPTVVVGYLYGAADFPDAYRAEEQPFIESGRPWTAVWSSLTGERPDYDHLKLRAYQPVPITPDTAARLLRKCGVDPARIGDEVAKASLPTPQESEQ